MNMRAVLAVFAALIFGGCAGFIIAYAIERGRITELTKQCKECSEKLSKLSKEYDEFVKSAYTESHWPRQVSTFSGPNAFADYLKDKYLDTETEFVSDCEDESDNLYI